VDGISVTSSAQGRGNSFNIPLEAVREFSVQSGAYSAEFGNVAGGVINLQSKSGTNHWHGSLFEFFRNTDLNANTFFFNATGTPRATLNQNQYGGTVGGPVQRDKTFYFFSFQGTRQDRIHLDEEPKLEIYAECNMRLMSTVPGEKNGTLVLTETPLLGVSDLMITFMPDLSPEPDAAPTESWDLEEEEEIVIE